MMDMPSSTERKKLRGFKAAEVRRGKGRRCVELSESNRRKDYFHPEEVGEETLPGWKDLGYELKDVISLSLGFGGVARRPQYCSHRPLPP